MTSSTQHFAWWVYVCILAVYTGFALGFAYMDGSAPVFSKRNAKPVAAIVLAHGTFLAIVMAFLWFANYIRALLPNWITEETTHGTTSIYEIMFVVGFLGIAFAERRWIFVESCAGGSETGTNLS
jgi:hypothetical protein